MPLLFKLDPKPTLSSTIISAIKLVSKPNYSTPLIITGLIKASHLAKPLLMPKISK